MSRDWRTEYREKIARRREALRQAAIARLPGALAQAVRRIAEAELPQPQLWRPGAPAEPW